MLTCCAFTKAPSKIELLVVKAREGAPLLQLVSTNRTKRAHQHTRKPSYDHHMCHSAVYMYLLCVCDSTLARLLYRANSEEGEPAVPVLPTTTLGRHHISAHATCRRWQASRLTSGTTTDMAHWGAARGLSVLYASHQTQSSLCVRYRRRHFRCDSRAETTHRHGSSWPIRCLTPCAFARC
jgi:hypothetical protein